MKVVISDLDGTLFAPDLSIIKTPFLNFQSSQIMKRDNIPFIIITGRPTWSFKDEVLLKLIGLLKPDKVIIGLGTDIFIRNKDGELKKDKNWEKTMQSLSWNKDEVIKKITPLVNERRYEIKQEPTTHLLRIYIPAQLTEKVLSDKVVLEKLLGNSSSIYIAESRIRKNTEEDFAGYLMIVPSTIGKDKMIKLVLNELPTNSHNEVLIMGDGMVDVPMLQHVSTVPNVTLKKYLVSATPLSKREILKNSEGTEISKKDGPSTLFEYVKESTSKINPHNISKAQNSPLRMLINPLEGFLDSLMDKDLSPNEISFLGLKYMLRSQKEGHSSMVSTLILWTKAMGMDLLDGLRARRQGIKTVDGQLVDVFSDRAKEFIQLYFRALERLKNDNQQGVQTLLSAISCIQPSLARAEAESSGIVVSELDTNGGSMLSRSFLLFRSFAAYLLKMNNSSYKLDMLALKRNTATYQSRKKAVLSNQGVAKADSSLIVKGKERFQLLSYLFQEQHEIIEKTLEKDSEARKQYDEHMKQFAEYLSKSIEKEDKQKFENLGLSIKKYL